jgi:hypothetical protein
LRFRRDDGGPQFVLALVLGDSIQERFEDADEAGRRRKLMPRFDQAVVSHQKHRDGRQIPEVSVLLRESDMKTFEGRLVDADIQVIRAPEAFSEWEHALSVGSAVAETVDGADELDRFRDASDPQWVHAESPTGEFPVVVVSNGDRMPYTTDVRLTDDEHVIVLRRLAIQGRVEQTEPV